MRGEREKEKRSEKSESKLGRIFHWTISLSSFLIEEFPQYFSLSRTESHLFPSNHSHFQRDSCTEFNWRRRRRLNFYLIFFQFLVDGTEEPIRNTPSSPLRVVLWYEWTKNFSATTQTRIFLCSSLLSISLSRSLHLILFHSNVICAAVCSPSHRLASHNNLSFRFSVNV